MVGRRRQVSAKYSPKHVREGAYNLTRKGNYRRRITSEDSNDHPIHETPQLSNPYTPREKQQGEGKDDSNPARRDADALYGCMVLIVLHGVRSYRGSKDLRNAPAKGDMSAIMLLNEKETKK